MFKIRYAREADILPDSRLREWLLRENPFLGEQQPEGAEWDPDNTGWLLVLEPGDNPESLCTGVEAVSDLAEVDCWEWAVFNDELDMWNAVAILGDSFGLAFAIPGALVRGTELEARLEEVLA